MLHTLRALWRDELAFVISAELVLILTVAVLAMIVGLHAVAKAVVMEFNDVSNAFGAIEQSYFYKGLSSHKKSRWAGSAFKDREDECDCTVIRQEKPRPKVDGGGGGPESAGGQRRYRY